MDFSLFLSCYFPDTRSDTGRSSAAVYGEMLEMARAAEALGYCGVTLPEHHFMNILMNPSPLMLAVAVAKETRRIPITTAVVALPLNDMRRTAGEVALADILTEGRIQIGVGRGAFAYEFERFGVPFEKSREIFDESLDVLLALLTGEEVSWDGEYYTFEALTVMPRPLQQPHPPIWIAALAPVALYHCAKRGLNVQTTPLQGGLDLAKQQAEAFMEGAAESGRDPRPRLSLLRAGFCARDETEVRERVAQAHAYYRRFDNVFKSAGAIERGAIGLIDIEATREDMAEALFIGTPEMLIDKLGPYTDLGVDEINLNMCIGAGQAETLDSIERLAEEVMPRFARPLRLTA